MVCIKYKILWESSGASLPYKVQYRPRHACTQEEAAKLTLLVGQLEKLQQHSDGRCCVCPYRPLSPRPQLSVFLHHSVLCSLVLFQRIALEEPGVHTLPLLPPEGCTSALMSHIIEAPPLLQQQHTQQVVCLNPNYPVDHPKLGPHLNFIFIGFPHVLTISVINTCTKSLL